ncbi:F-box/LRR-repeat protein 6-like [Argiope bruennichi]|uniref:F-box/LRR-repeat protein 6-like n=1 Tax=Argiope bruennichi TaxID=94029 RepID=UPI0024942F3A|nr:F-box/LRR-repeat protein 6-like [Argiope bruennichi]
MTNINNLPREILLQIFAYYLKTETQRDFIRSVAHVCQYWKEICMDSSLWHTFDGTLSLNDLKKYCKMGCLKNTESLVFSYRKRTLTSSEVQLIYENLPRLKFINFSKVTEQVGKEEWKFLSELTNHCPNLCDIIFLETHSLYPPKLPFKLFQNFLNVRGSNLISLDISNLSILSFRDLFITVAASCPNLECLKAQNLRGGSNSFPIQYMQNGLKKLKVLRLGHPILMQNCSSVSTSGFPHLDTFTHASKNDCFIEDLHLRKLLMKSPDLKVLDIRGCVLLTSTVLCSLPANNLERLYVSNTRLYELHGFANVLKKWGHSLVALDVSKMKGSCINHLFQSLVSLDSLKNLESLDLNNTVVTVSTVKLIIQNCPNLNFLQLESCRSFGRGRKHAYYGQAKIKQLLNLEDEMEAD